LAAKVEPAPELQEQKSTELLESLVGYRLRRANGRMMTDFASTLAPLAIRPVLFGMLAVIRVSPGIIQMALGTELGIQRANLVPLVNELESRGLVERRPAPRDRRAAALYLTRAGEALFEEAVALVREHEERMLRRLSASERTKLIELLGKIAAE
jgi:DNA-binding MarR family transcriptional regulator